MKCLKSRTHSVGLIGISEVRQIKQAPLNNCSICGRTSPQRQNVKLFIGWISVEWSGIINRILEDATACGHQIQIIDVTNWFYPRVSVNLRRALGGADIQQLSTRKTSSKARILGLMQGESVSDWVQESVTSELRTKYRGKVPWSLQWLEALEAKIVSRRAVRVFRACIELESSDKEVWVYPNGRYSAQRAILEAAREKGVRTLCYERSRFPEKAFIRTYRVHDRVEIQKDAERLSSNISKESLDAVSNWLNDRTRPDSRSNPFSAKFMNSLEAPSNTEQKYAVFFSSSRDELEGLGQQWTHFSWKDQYTAFRAVGEKLSSLGFKNHLRLHPNLANKSSRDIEEELAEVMKLRDMGFEIFGPDSPVSSYDLAKRGSVIVASRSTIGLEAMCMGIPLILTSNSFYDNLSKLFLARGVSDLDRFERYLNEFDADSASEIARAWLATQWELDVEKGATAVFTPTKQESFMNALRPSVVFYYLSQIAVASISRNKHKSLINRLSELR